MSIIHCNLINITNIIDLINLNYQQRTNVVNQKLHFKIPDSHHMDDYCTLNRKTHFNVPFLP